MVARNQLPILRETPTAVSGCRNAQEADLALLHKLRCWAGRRRLRQRTRACAGRQRYGCRHVSEVELRGPA